MNATDNENKVQQEAVEKTTAPKTPSAKDRVMEDGKLTFWEILFVARYFIPIVTTIGWAIIATLGKTGGIFETFGLVFVGIGLISAITVSPLKFIKFILTSTIKGFRILRSLIPVYGVADLMAALFGATFGFVFGVVVVFGLPAVFTITKFFREDSFQ